MPTTTRTIPGREAREGETVDKVEMGVKEGVVEEMDSGSATARIYTSSSTALGKGAALDGKHSNLVGSKIIRIVVCECP